MFWEKEAHSIGCKEVFLIRSVLTLLRGNDLDLSQFNCLQVMRKPHSLSEAETSRDSFSKALYDRLFTWNVGHVNAAIDPALTEAASDDPVRGRLKMTSRFSKGRLFETSNINQDLRECRRADSTYQINIRALHNSVWGPLKMTSQIAIFFFYSNLLLFL